MFKDCLGDIESDILLFNSNFFNQFAESFHVLESETFASLVDHELKTRPQRYICILTEDFVKFAPIFEVEQIVWLPNLYTSKQIEVFMECFL